YIGGSFNVALKEDGTVWAWGANGDGQLGDGTTIDKYYAVQVLDELMNPFTGVSAISAGSYHTVALKRDGTIWAWGDGWRGGLGNRKSKDKLNPVPASVVSKIPGLKISSIIAGGAATYVLSKNGSIWGWGKNNRGQMGNGTNDKYASKDPVQMSSKLGEPIRGIISFDASWANTGFLKANGTVWMCGSNETGQLGTGELYDDIYEAWHPVQVRDSNNLPFVWSAIPKIESLSKNTGAYKDKIIIKGIGFENERGRVLIVDNNGIATASEEILLWRNDKIKFRLPWGVTAGDVKIIVENSSGNQSEGESFTYMDLKPVIKKVSRQCIKNGSKITIIGKNFGRTGGGYYLRERGFLYNVLFWSERKIKIKVTKVYENEKNIWNLQIRTRYGDSKKISFERCQ
ncbi:MAG: hypothetical protein D6734_01315, partial [Candidatus Schekmanbacteria bacterium]